MERSTANKLDGTHLRAVIERELKAERHLKDAEARALRDVIDGRDARHTESDPVVAAYVTARAAIEPSVCRARGKLIEARTERRMAEHLIAGHLLDIEGGR
jgi:hypothetical protein